MSKPRLSAEDIAEHVGVPKRTVQVWIADKDVSARTLSRLWKFRASAVDAGVRGGGSAGGAA